jgi:hypothetical protein
MLVLFGTVLIVAAHSALEDVEITFNGIRSYVAPDILAASMMDRFMLGRFLTDCDV